MYSQGKCIAKMDLGGKEKICGVGGDFLSSHEHLIQCNRAATGRGHFNASPLDLQTSFGNRSSVPKQKILITTSSFFLIARAAVESNSFCGPLRAGLWSEERMAWIKPSAVWVGYRCGCGRAMSQIHTTKLVLTLTLTNIHD